MNVAYISIGSNIGDRLLHLTGAVQALHSQKYVKVLDVSSIYETAPVGYIEQADFLNIVIYIETALSAHDLLLACQEIENELGRVREVRWGPRTVDLDILLYNDDHVVTENLVIPHPRMHERAFVLIPLLEIAPTLSDPVSAELYAEGALVQDEGVLLWKKIKNVAQFLGI